MLNDAQRRACERGCEHAIAVRVNRLEEGRFS